MGNINWFMIAMIVLQFGASANYVLTNKWDCGILMFLYAVANIVVYYMGVK